MRQTTPDNPTTIPLTNPTSNQPRTAKKWMTKILRRRKAKTLQRDVLNNMEGTNRQYIIDANNDELKVGIRNGTIATTAADSGATSGVGTITIPCHHSG